jgi:hypothetical protein
MEPNQPSFETSSSNLPGYGQTPVPNAVGALVLGIISIPTCICYGVPGLVCGVIAIVLGSRAVTAYQQDPQRYTQGSYNNALAGRVCGIIGTALSALFLAYILIFLIIYGTLASSIIGSFIDQVKHH